MWNLTDQTLPAVGHRVLTETQEGSTLYATLQADGIWIDDTGATIPSPVVRWREVVSAGETAP